MRNEVRDVRRILVLLFLVAVALFPATAVATDDPVTVVGRVYGAVFKVVRTDNQGRPLCRLRDTPSYEQADFTPEMFALLLAAKQSFEDCAAGKRTDFWDTEVLSGSQTNTLCDQPAYRLQSQVGDRAVVEVRCDGRGFVKQYSRDDNNPANRVPYAWKVQLRREANRWLIANILFPYHKDLLTESRAFLQGK